MSEHDWDQLFDLVEKAINLEGLTASEKGDKTWEEATARDQEGNLQEFVAQLDY